MKKNILFILHLPPPVHGHAIVGSYIKKSTVINEEFNCTYINLSVSHDLASVGKNSFKKYRASFKIACKLIAVLSKKHFDLCYMTPSARTPAFYKDFVFILILKLFNLKTLYHFHNKGVSVSSNSHLNKVLYRNSFKNSKVILLSKSLYPDIANYVKFSDVFICPNGSPVIDGKIPLKISPHKKCSILFLSNMIIDKGILLLLDACKILIDKEYDIECNFVGDWAEISPEEFENEIKIRNLTNIVFAHGKKYDQEKYEFYRQADIFVFPTFYKNETFGLVNIEAMQFGLPIISTYIGGIPDVVADNETGYLIAPNNTAALVEKLEVLVSDPKLRARLGNEGLSRFKEKFTLARFEERMRNILQTA